MSNAADFIRQIADLQGAAVVLTAFLILVALVVLPREERGFLRLPTLLLVAHVSVIAFSFGVSGGTAPSRHASVVAVLLIFTALARVSFLLVVDWLIGTRLKSPLPKIFRDIVQGVFYLAVTVIALREIGFDLSSLLTTSAILTAVLGLSLQESVGNIIAGLAVQGERPFQVGDWIQIGEDEAIVGQVVEINWRATKIRSNDLTEIIVPNAAIAKSPIHNFVRPVMVTRRKVAFSAPYEVPPGQVERAIDGCLSHIAGLTKTPSPHLWTDGFEDSGIRYQLVYFIDDFGRRQSIESEVRNRLWHALDRAGISMPYPIRDVRLVRAAQPPLVGSIDWDSARSAKLLDRVEFFDFLPESVRKRIAELASPERYGRGEPIVIEGQAGTDLFVVAVGRVAVVTDSPTGENLELASLGPGSLFGELSLVTGTRGATVLAAIESLVLRVSHDAFRRAVEEVPGLTEVVLAQLTERGERLAVRPSDAPEAVATAEFRQALFNRIRRLFSSS